jgi:uncharacterized protein YndB with AHSA1/START domain
MSLNEKSDTSRSFLIEEAFQAPVNQVFDAWLNPEKIVKWMAPAGFTSFSKVFEPRPGGLHHYCMKSGPHEMWGMVKYEEIIPPSRLVYLQSFSDANGGIGRHPMSATWPLVMRTEVSFSEKDGETHLTLQWTPIDASAEEQSTFMSAFDSMRKGWGGSFQSLHEFLKA